MYTKKPRHLGDNNPTDLQTIHRKYKDHPTFKLKTFVRDPLNRIHHIFNFGDGYQKTTSLCTLQKLYIN